MEGRYRAGLGIFLDVIDAQAALTTANANLVNAQSALDQSRAALYRALGRPIPGP
jgi:outer membrane protein TolC